MKFRGLTFSTIALSIFLSTACSATQGDENGLALPSSINEVQTYRVGDKLVRLIKHNMEVAAQFDIELLSTPDLEVISTLSIRKITVEGVPLSFESSQGVFVEDFSVEDSSVFVEFDYFYPSSGSDLIRCSVNISEDKIGAPDCNKK